MLNLIFRTVEMVPCTEHLWDQKPMMARNEVQIGGRRAVIMDDRCSAVELRRDFLAAGIVDLK